VHPQIIERFQEGVLSEALQEAGEREGLTKAEAAVLAFLSADKEPARIAA
jgi:DNA topoisomerase IB